MNDRLVTEIKRAMAELADATPPTPPLDELLAGRHEPPAPRRPKLFAVTAIAVSLAAAIAALVLISVNVDHDTPTSPPTTAPAVTTPIPTTAPIGTTPATTPVTAAPVTAPPVRAAPVSTAASTTTAAAPPLAASFAPLSITWTSLQQGWLLGTVDCQNALQCAALAHTDDGGRTWHPATVPSGIPAFDPNTGPGSAERVRFADADNGWIFGTDLYGTHDGGSTWAKVNGMSDVISLEVAKGRAWAEAASTDSPDKHVLSTSSATTDDWHQVGTMAVLLLIALHGDTGYVGGADGGLFAVSPSGFDVRTDPCVSGTDLGAIAVADDQTVAVTCGSSAMGSELKQVNVSHDGGRTFTAVGEAPFAGIATSCVASSPTTFALAATSGASWIYRTTDGGKTWKTVFQDNSGGAPLTDLGFTDATHGVAVLGTQPSVLLTTTDGGATWKKAAIHD